MKTPPNQTAFKSAPDKANRSTKTKVYLAGKIDKYDWRHDLVPGLRGHRWEEGPIAMPTFNYVGPFFVSCDHGCLHEPNQHGATRNGLEDICGEDGWTRQQVIERNNAAIALANLVLAYITTTDCYGTLCEIGMALARNKRVVMCFAPTMPEDDFWFIAGQCAAVYRGARTNRLRAVLAAEVAAISSGRRASC